MNGYHGVHLAGSCTGPGRVRLWCRCGWRTRCWGLTGAVRWQRARCAAHAHVVEERDREVIYLERLWSVPSRSGR